MILFNYLILCCPQFLLPTIFSNQLVLHIRLTQYWNFNFSISPSNQYSGLSSFRIHWFDLLAVQKILKSLLQHHNSKASILRHSVFFMVQLSLLYLPIRKTVALTLGTFVSRMICLLFNMLSRFVITFLQRSKRLLISWLQSPFAMILQPKKVKCMTASTFSSSAHHEVMGLDAMILVCCRMLSSSQLFHSSLSPS